MVSIVISGLLSLPSCYLGNEVGKKLKTKNGQNRSSEPFSHDTAQQLKLFLNSSRMLAGQSEALHN